MSGPKPDVLPLDDTPMCLANLGGAFKALLCLRDIYYSKDVQGFVNLFREFFLENFFSMEMPSP